MFFIISSCISYAWFSPWGPRGPMELSFSYVSSAVDVAQPHDLNVSHGDYNKRVYDVLLCICHSPMSQGLVMLLSRMISMFIMLQTFSYVSSAGDVAQPHDMCFIFQIRVYPGKCAYDVLQWSCYPPMFHRLVMLLSRMILMYLMLPTCM